MSNLASIVYDEMDNFSSIYDSTLKSIPNIDNTLSEALPDAELGDVMWTDFNTTKCLKELNLNKTDVKHQYASDSQVDLEQEFYCVIYEVDSEEKLVFARVYDTEENVEVLDIDAPFSNFTKDDQKLIRENAIFYWRIGTKTVSGLNKHNKVSRKTSNFSDFTMRRLYTSKRFHAQRIKAQIQRFDSVFAD
ncbi:MULTISPECIES: hypothetical protein [Vibrio]|uniref:Uncharacterized protein n=1 Tax=Vibrio atlanticus TaxID=693153 RepID=A0ABV4KUG7_9VIBR